MRIIGHGKKKAELSHQKIGLGSIAVADLQEATNPKQVRDLGFMVHISQYIYIHIYIL